MQRNLIPAVVSVVLFAILATLPASVASACPFCVSEMQTLSEEMADADSVVIAKLSRPAPVADGLAAESAPSDGGSYSTVDPETVDPETGEATFVVETVLKGEGALDGELVEAIYFGQTDFEASFLIRGIGDPVEWAIPLGLSPLAVDYVQQLPKLPAGGAERLAFFQPYLEHEDRQLAQDAYDEFARAPYADLLGLADQIDRPRVLAMINDPQIAPSRRRLFFTMLGVCGGLEDVPMLESLLTTDAGVLAPAVEAAIAADLLASGPLASVLTIEVVKANERRRKLGLDAMIACYLTLRGAEGLDLVDRRFLANPDADQTHLYSVLMALRFLGDDEANEGVVSVPRERLLASARLLLDHPVFADQVITDLARWQDWDIMFRLAEMYRDACEERNDVSTYVREPIITYLDVASEQEGIVGEQAADLLAELEPLDPETFRRARSLAQFGFLGRARPLKPAAIEDAQGGAATNDDDLPPDPASFQASVDPPDEAESAAADTDATKLARGESADEEAKDQATDSVASEPARALPIPAGAEPLAAPSRAALVGLPLLAAAGCFGLFWFLLRGGA